MACQRSGDRQKAAPRTGALVLSEDTRRRGGLITRIRRASWFDQQNVDLTACHGPMLNALGHDKYLAGAEGGMTENTLPKGDPSGIA
jgi:hypothetical protein